MSLTKRQVDQQVSRVEKTLEGHKEVRHANTANRTPVIRIGMIRVVSKRVLCETICIFQLFVPYRVDRKYSMNS